MQELVDIVQSLSSLFLKSLHSLYLVGGAVRDFLLSRNTYDLDLVTDATPEEVMQIIPDANDVFKSFGVIKYKIGKYHLDITTLREESGYFDARHPKKIIFVKDIKQDVKRRDFTINALYMDQYFKIYDFVGGQEDLKNKVVRMIGDPTIRIKEDPLRIVRALRFALDLHFTIDKKLADAIKDNINLLSLLNPAKIHEEITKIKLQDNEQIYLLFNEFGITKYLSMLK